MSRTIGLLYDTHVIAGDRQETDGVEVTMAAIEKLNEVGVDWTVMGGDMRTLTPPFFEQNDWGRWHGDPDNYYYREDFEKIKGILDGELDSEYFVIRGNNERPLDVYREFFPEEEYPLWYWFVDEGARYVFLDSNPHGGYHGFMDTQNFVSAPQIAMLERLMDDDPEIPTFVFCHVPLAKHTEIRNDWASTTFGSEGQSAAAYFITLNYPTVQRVLERGNTVFVNTGHYYKDHGRGSKVVEGVEYVLARHLVHLSEPDYAGDVRWMTVDIEDRSAEVNYYDVGRGEEGTLTETTW